jgi:hypothetical protein
MRDIDERMEKALQEMNTASPDKKGRWTTLVRQAKESYEILLSLIDYAFPEFKQLGVHDIDLPRVEILLRESISHHYQPEGVREDKIVFNSKIIDGKLRLGPGNLYTAILMHGMWVKYDVIEGAEAFETPMLTYMYRDEVHFVIPTDHPLLKIFDFNHIEGNTDTINKLNKLFELPGIDENDNGFKTV